MSGFNVRKNNNIKFDFSFEEELSETHRTRILTPFKELEEKANRVSIESNKVKENLAKRNKFGTIYKLSTVGEKIISVKLPFLENKRDQALIALTDEEAPYSLNHGETNDTWNNIARILTMEGATEGENLFTDNLVGDTLKKQFKKYLDLVKRYNNDEEFKAGVDAIPDKTHYWDLLQIMYGTNEALLSQSAEMPRPSQAQKKEREGVILICNAVVGRLKSGEVGDLDPDLDSDVEHTVSTCITKKKKCSHMIDDNHDKNMTSPPKNKAPGEK
jgi:hypothetical protein